MKVEKDKFDAALAKLLKAKIVFSPAGTRVVFIDTWNTWREQIVCPADKLVPVPGGLDDSAAATSYINP